jgi:hypothetical protein
MSPYHRDLKVCPASSISGRQMSLHTYVKCTVIIALANLFHIFFHPLAHALDRLINVHAR